MTTTKPPLKVPATYTYTEVAAALNVPVSYVKSEVGAGRLLSFPKGRFMVVTQAELDAWFDRQRERAEDKRAGKVAQHDQKPKRGRAPKAKKGRYAVTADADILEALGLPT